GCFHYDPRTGRTRRLASPSNGAWAGPALASEGRYVLMIGGAARASEKEWKNQSDILRYDSRTDSWTQIGNLPLRARGMGAWRVAPDTVYCAGGYADRPEGGGGFSDRGFLISISTGKVREAVPL